MTPSSLLHTSPQHTCQTEPGALEQSSKACHQRPEYDRNLVVLSLVKPTPTLVVEIEGCKDLVKGSHQNSDSWLVPPICLSLRAALFQS